MEFDPSASEGEAEEVGLKWRKDGTEIGTLVHRLMETVVNRIEETISKNELSVLIDNILLLNKVTAENKESLRNGLLRVAEQIYAGGFTQNHVKGSESVPADILRELRQSEEIYTELPFSVYVGSGDTLMTELADKLEIETGKDGYINGVMDLVYKKDGNWHICDYKSNFSTQDLLEHYEGQLILYQEILKMLFGLEDKPGAYLYHIPVRSEEAHEEMRIRQ